MSEKESDQPIKKEEKSKDTNYSLLSAVLILMLLGISGMNIWMYLEFKKIQFSTGVKSSNPYKIVNDILWTLMIAPGAMAIISGVLFLIVQYVNYDIGYQIPLILIIVSLIVLTILQMIISYYWPQLKIEQINQEYIDFSRTLLFTGYLSLPLVLFIVILWLINSSDLVLSAGTRIKSMKQKKLETDLYKLLKSQGIDPETQQEILETIQTYKKK